MSKKDTVTRCGATVTLNNTYWQAPTTLSADSTCSLDVKMDPTLPEQRRNPICQVRWVYYIISVIPRAEPKPTQRTWLLYRKRIDEILMCVYIIDWISKLSPSPDPIPRPFALRTTSGWAGLPIKCRLFAAKMSANTVSWFRCYHRVYKVILNDVQIRFQCIWLPRRRRLMFNWYSRWALARHRIVIGRSGSVYFPALLRIYLVVLLSALRHKDRSYNFILFLFKKLLTIVSSISRKVSGLSDRLIGVKCRHRRQGPVSWPIRTTTFASGRSRSPTPTLSLG